MSWWADVRSDFKKHGERASEFWNSPALGKWNSYSDFVSSANELTDGWYGTIADAIPYASNVHRAVLSRDRTNDVLDNTGQSWSDVIGYNSNALTGGAAAPLAGMKGKIEDGKNDLFEFYTGQKDYHRLPHRRGF